MTFRSSFMLFSYWMWFELDNHSWFCSPGLGFVVQKVLPDELVLSGINTGVNLWFDGT